MDKVWTSTLLHYSVSNLKTDLAESEEKREIMKTHLVVEDMPAYTVLRVWRFDDKQEAIEKMAEIRKENYSDWDVESQGETEISLAQATYGATISLFEVENGDEIDIYNN